ncbi:unnamed protein product [Malassezia sympodialis ATCC 42132]|nr:uncharacterized protein MSY001_0873 [Malassezia sympodialis ATCC 42132]CCU98167.1 unnamed protein product [Malassezia sympodialis ATCC 42132]|eukprot:XP_018739487.1 uncharacterized protein MSY001_0873 [Malassezia sympodialis ATCC 42132]
MLKVPDTEYYASRIVRSKPFYDRQKGMFTWKRFAIVKVTDEASLRSGETIRKFEVPWPKGGQRRRPFQATHADGRTVEEETWVPWVPEDPVLLPARKPRSTPAGEAQAAAQYAEWEAHVAQKRALAESATVATPPGAHAYAGFVVRETVRPPPIAQAPKPSEMVHMERRRLAEFVQANETQAHLEQGGAIFAASDYLDVAPLVGPAAGGEWGALDEASAGAQRDETGRLVARPGQSDVHAMPIELLMGRDLANERGLKWRMRRWKTARAAEAVALAEKEQESKDLLQELKALRV